GLSLALPGTLAGSLTPRVSKLDADLGGTVTLAGIDDTLHRHLVLIVRERRATVRDAPDELDSCRLHHQEAGARVRQRAEVQHVPVRHIAVLGRVLAHGRDNDPVGEL